MPFSAFAQNYMLTQLTTNHGGWLSLHTAYSNIGGNELTGGSPAYARVVPAWGTAAGGSISTTSVASVFNIPASTTINFVGLWDASSGGNFQGMGAAGPGQVFAFTGVPTGSLFTAPSSGYAANQAVVLWQGLGEALPTPFVVGTVYYVVSPSGNNFQLSATSGGGAITITGIGSGQIQSITPATFGIQGTYSVTTETLTII